MVRLRALVLLLAATVAAACASTPAAPVNPAPASPPLPTPASPPPPSTPPLAPGSPVPPTPERSPVARPSPPATLASTTVAPTSPQPPALTADLVLIGARLIDGTGAPPQPDAAIAIQGDRIIAVGRAGELPIAPGVRTIDLRGKTILPGFINAHVHSYTLNPEEMKTWTRVGVTTVRDLSGPLDLMTGRQRTFAASDDPELPRLRVAGPMLTVPGGHPIPIYGLNDRVLGVRGPEDARAQVEWLLDAGATQIKIAVSGRTDTGWPELSDAEIRAITAAAHARGARVSAHVDRAAGLLRAVEQGIDDAAHMPRDRMPDDLITLMVDRFVALVPTIDVYENLAEERGIAAEWRQTTLPVMQDNLRRFVAAGGILALGDDYGNPRVSLGMPLDEIEQWINAGLTPVQVIMAATRGGAIVCGLDAGLGVIAPGMAADILVVDGDPLADYRALGRPALVIRGGVVAFSGP